MNTPAEVATLERPAVSPSQKYILAVISREIDGEQMLNFQIQAQDQTVLYVSNDVFSARHTTFFLWDTEDRVWVYSGDVGTFFWENQGIPDAWEKFSYAKSNVPAPEFLKKNRPRWHQK